MQDKTIINIFNNIIIGFIAIFILFFIFAIFYIPTAAIVISAFISSIIIAYFLGWGLIYFYKFYKRKKL
jgi:hypothetical protein